MQSALVLVAVLYVGQDRKHGVQLLIQCDVCAEHHYFLPLAEKLLVRVCPLQRLLVKQILIRIRQRVYLEVQVRVVWVVGVNFLNAVLQDKAVICDLVELVYQERDVLQVRQ